MRTQGLVIRPIEPEDYEQWLPLWAGYNRFYGRPEMPEEITRTTWARFFDAGEPMHALVAELDHRLIGITHYLFHRSTTQVALTCYLQDLFTEEASRGLGVGRALIESVYERAQAAGSPRVYWLTHQTNSTAMKLYDKVADRSGFMVYRKVF